VDVGAERTIRGADRRIKRRFDFPYAFLRREA